MAIFLTPDSIYTANGLTVKRRIIPFGLKSSKTIYSNGIVALAKGNKFKADSYLNTKDHQPLYITIHNTDDITPSDGTTKSEQYSRATYPNENMNTSRIHYYVCEKEAWQNLLDTEIGWHVSYSLNKIANDQSVAIEIIGSSAQAEENGAKLTAYLMKKYNIPLKNVRTHNSWSGKYCPCWILPHWDDFLERVEQIYSGNPASATKKNTKEKSVRYVMESLGQAAIREDASKNSAIKKRAKKGSFYLIDRLIVSEQEQQWLRHWREGSYSMYEDGQILFKKIDEFDVYNTKVKLNIRKEPTTQSSIVTVVPVNTKLCALRGKVPVLKNNFSWLTIVYNNQIAYAALEYLEKGE